MAAKPEFHFEEAPELPGADHVHKYGFGAVRHLVNMLWNVEVEGLENVPLTGPALITPNHLSFCDSIFVPAVLPRRVWAIGKGEYMDDWKTKHIFPAFGMIPVDRRGGRAAEAALDIAASVLDGGHLFMMYPEGTRSRSGNLHKGRTGAARLAIRCNAPIVPVGHIGTVDIQPPDSVMIKPFKKCTIRIGKPIRAEDVGDPGDPRLKRLLIDRVMYEISQLSGQTYMDTYAGKAGSPPAASKASPAGPSDAMDVPSPPRSISVPPGRSTIAASVASTMTLPVKSATDVTDPISLAAVAPVGRP